MKKLVIKCPKCKKKMKIMDKPAKYRCPSCKEVYKYTKFKQVTNKILTIFKDAGKTGVDIKNNIKNKYKMSKNTYKYMKQVKKNMKNNPNWSNYHKEQREMKDVTGSKKGLKGIFNKFKKQK
jgi:predicted RNA-binding Zn-ribbon protein involved in translation (DUF1610 family)